MIIASKPKVSLDLNASDTTNIHRGGMTGLWMSLKQLEKKYLKSNQRPGNLTWDLTANTISLDWQGEDFLVIDWLLKQSFQISDKGLIQFIALEAYQNLINQIHIHQVIHDTFLRNSKSYKKEKVDSQVLKVNGKSIKLKYRALNWYVHQTFAKQLCDQAGYLINGYIRIVSWLYPGATVRHTKLTEITKIEEKTEYAFALLFLPIVCQYFILHSSSVIRNRKQPTRYAIVVPDTYNFEAAANRYWHSHNKERKYQDCYVTNLGDAALRTFSHSQSINSPQECQVLVYEKLDKKSRQRTIAEIADFTVTPQAIRDYQFVSKYFIDNKIFINDKSFTVKVNLIRAIIAENLAQNLPWWLDLWEKLYEVNPFESEDIDKQIIFNCRGLLAMLERDTKLQRYQDFIRAFHEALRKIYAKTYDRKSSRVENNHGIDKKYRSILSEIRQCYDQKSLENFLADFLSRGGLNSSLYDRWEEILPLIVIDKNWKKIRNLSLFALASYKPRRFSLQSISIKFWKTLLKVDHQAAILFLLKEPVLEILPETQQKPLSAPET